MKHVSRREFSAMMAAGLVSGHLPGPLSLRGQPAVARPINDLIERIKQNLGVEWRAETVDGVKAGDPSREVTGVVVTSLATLPLLQQAAGLGANLIVTSGSTFYSRADARQPRAGRGGGPGPGPAGAPAATPGAAAPPPPPPPEDPVFNAKNAFIDQRGLVIFRLSDHWRARKPDPFALGLARMLGGTAYGPADDTARFEIPPTTLEGLANSLKRSLGARGGIRVVGERNTPVRRVALLPGTTPIRAALAALPTADVVIAGEVREWESIEYARDVVHDGQPKGFITVGRVLSEDPGMRLMAEWLGTLVPEVSIRHISAGDPYWRPQP